MFEDLFMEKVRPDGRVIAVPATKFVPSEERWGIQSERNGVLISTVFLAMLHTWGEEGGVLYETAVDNGDGWLVRGRYANRAEAIRGHEQVVGDVIRETSTMPLWTAVPDRLLDLYREGEKIQAIKEYRNLNHELCPGVQIKPTLRAAKSALEAADIFDGRLPLVITEGSYTPALQTFAKDSDAVSEALVFKVLNTENGNRYEVAVLRAIAATKSTAIAYVRRYVHHDHAVTREAEVRLMSIKDIDITEIPRKKTT